MKTSDLLNANVICYIQSLKWKYMVTYMYISHDFNFNELFTSA